jgi:NAD(P)-dependent dehydrogenase (short-subunit alcohol dehydrogenase family)
MLPAEYDVTGKVVFITGAGRGIGKGIAQVLANAGADIALNALTPKFVEPPAAEIAKASGRRVEPIVADVTKPDSIAAALAASGPLDALVNNAGIGALGAFEATPMEMAREVFETNTFGVMAMTQAVLPQLRARGAGVVVGLQVMVLQFTRLDQESWWRDARLRPYAGQAAEAVKYYAEIGTRYLEDHPATQSAGLRRHSV